MLRLKEYQQKVLNVLQVYCRRVSQTLNAHTAFYETTRDVFGAGMPYTEVAELPGLPYVCIRIPTGGGKTLVACHSVPIMKNELLQSDTALVLWLVPSNTIREQTIVALRDTSHPYRQALDSALGNVAILDISEALNVHFSVLDAGTTIIIATMQAFRVEDTEGRKVYETNGALMSHFDGLERSIVDKLERRPEGTPAYSLANVIRLHRPIVIVDEAHNLRTQLSFTTLSRFRPSAVLELTATPHAQDSPSNVIASVSAAELQAEDMIKMPILLETVPNWRQLLSNALARLEYLQQCALDEFERSGEYIRPIMLLQAQPEYKERASISVNVLIKTLIDEFKVNEDEIARATGTERGLDGIDIQAHGCRIRYVVTVQALREGWDCPFAYVLCSVAEMSSGTAVEQLLGRIMRLPGATRKNSAELNKAYAYVASMNFATTAEALVDGLVQNGYNELEAKQLLVQQLPTQPSLGPLFDSEGVENRPHIVIYAPEQPDLSLLPNAVSELVKIDPLTGYIVFQGHMIEEARDILKSVYTTTEGKTAVEHAFWKSQQLYAHTASHRGADFSLPVLAVKQGDLLEELDKTHFLEHLWRLSQKEPILNEEEYPAILRHGQQGLIYVSDRKHVSFEFVESLHQQMTMLAANTGWSVSELVYWLDRAIPHPDITPEESGAYLTKLVLNLIGSRGITLDQLVHDKYRLATAIRKQIDHYRQTAYDDALQNFLLPNSPLVVSPELCFTFESSRNPPYSQPCPSKFPWNKHFYPVVGDLKAQGEEYECARYIDTCEEVEFWVRNPSRTSRAFSLQTSTDKFYPDFVCRLHDSRYLVVEYKGEAYRTNDDSKEKNAIGQLWERRSNGICLFIMISNREFAQVDTKIRR